MTYTIQYVGPWDGPVVADNVMCNGTEYNPYECEVEDPEPGCQNISGLAAVYCEEGRSL